MPVPSLNIPNYIKLYLPPNKRLPKYLAFFQSLCSGLTWRKEVWGAYRNGDPQSAYDAVVTYGIDDKVSFGFKTWQSLIDGNLGNQPGVNADAWIMRCPSHIGATERSKYNGRYLNLTYALNRSFNTVFRQPPYPAPYDYGLGGGVWSDIYITNSITLFSSLTVKTQAAANSPGTANSLVRTKPSGVVDRTIGFAGAVSSYQFTIHMPFAIFNALGANDAIRESVVRRAADQWVVSGTTYVIQTY